jgi:ubiquinone/menaquinone biosynthesis C-methylase UbiE
VSSAHYIREVQYKNADNLSARQSIYRYQQPRLQLWPLVLDLAELHGDERVIDVGCGNGLYLGALEQRAHRGMYCGLDFSPGMLPAAAAFAPAASLMVGDAQRLPFPDNSVDVALSLHMLYHVPDRAAAIAELRRVVPPDGRALVVTNSERHLAELDDVIAGACADTGREPIRVMERSMKNFSLESALPELRASFGNVELHELNSQLVITEVEPVLAYVRSMRVMVEAATAAHGDDLIRAVESGVARAIAADGSLTVRTRVGCFLCRD